MSANDERSTMSILVRTHLSMIEAAGGLRTLVAEVNPAIPVTRVSTLKEVVMSSAATEESLTRLLLGLAILAVSVGAVGVYSLISYTVSWRTREIGLRMALGANRTNIATWVLRESLLLAGVGSTAGFLGALSAVRVLRQFLFEISPADPLTYTVVAATMGFLALLAAWAPARRAARTDPMQALHMD
jgi:ABC-type antimicrobial peptide transport system permease subunit